jgi:hypothetical protein
MLQLQEVVAEVVVEVVAGLLLELEAEEVAEADLNVEREEAVAVEKEEADVRSSLTFNLIRRKKLIDFKSNFLFIIIFLIQHVTNFKVLNRHWIFKYSISHLL